tara:strand:- start:415 stop:684 length:270 start_codon:yes stop_codon:yes gene_type:complete
VKKEKKETELLSKKQQEELESMVSKLVDVAADAVKEYKDLDFSEMAKISGSITQIHEDSPFLNDLFKGDSWKKVIGSFPDKPKKIDDAD